MTKEIYSIFALPRYPGITFEGVSRTQQHFKDDCDVNIIIDRFMKTGVAPQIAEGFHYSDVSEVGDFRQQMEAVRHGQETFESLPSQVREQFKNDAAAFFEFVSDPDNLSALQDMGLAPKSSAEPVQPETLQSSEPETSGTSAT